MKSKRARDTVTVPAEGTNTTEEPPAKKRKSDSEGPDEVKQKKIKKDKKKEKKERKEKKDKKENRREKKDKRKNLQDLPEEELQSELRSASEKENEPTIEVGAEKEPSKNGKKEQSNGKDVNGIGKHDKVSPDDFPAEMVSKREKKSKREKSEAKNGVNGDAKKHKAKEDKKHKEAQKKKKKKETQGTQESQESQDEAKDPKDPEAMVTTNTTTASDKPKADRHIVFVGNLPYTATTASIKAHFAPVQPVAVRCLTQRKDVSLCRGVAFVDLPSAKAQRTCLDRFHHSTFDDGQSPSRKINVELTAGGGGKTKHRTEKILQRNKKLDENRSKRIEQEKVSKENAQRQDDTTHVDQQEQNMGDSIHPSRLARNPRLGK
ncbi:hypothetical protein CDD81_7452 [Ophiocordyceps australis]|uniref:RRM domain-containing protein n=1 Tax=Ophiocordyceps australis TaxID=1399860 RepID=A0A2C5YCF3_9HYPO|nr:hypothetical protein CDD81_7452 [Ophiocordyceps australis]